MRLFDIIRAEKSGLELGKWQEGTIPSKKWPVSRRGRALGRGWCWRIVQFEALHEEFSVLVALSEEKENYRAALGWFANDGFRVLCHHELHTSHFGWHCHFYNGSAEDIEPKKARDSETFKRWPIFSDDTCRVGFTLDKKSALTKAAERFRFHEKNEGMLF